MDKKVRYGILAAAGIAPRFINAVRSTDNGTVLAIASRSAEKARQFAKEYDIPLYYGDYRELLKNNDIDAVYIPTINALHYEYAKEALLADKHVIVEKPLVLHAKEGDELYRLAKERNLFITEAIKSPYLPLYKDIKEIIDSEEFGKLHMLVFRQSYNSGRYTTGWNSIRSLGGGTLFGHESYFFTIAELLCGEIQAITGSASFDPQTDVEEQVILSANLKNNVLASCTASRKILLNNGLFIYMDKGRIEIPDYWKADKAYVYSDDKLIRTIEYPCDYEMKYEVSYYSNCILNGLTSSPITPMENSIRYVSYCEKLLKKWE